MLTQRVPLFLALERKMSVRANREELIQKGILLPDPSIGVIQEGTAIRFMLPGLVELVWCGAHITQ